MTRVPRRDFAVLFAGLLVVAAGNTALQSVLPSIARVIRIQPALVAVIFSLSALLWTVSAPFWARQSDTRGRKKLMLIGVAGFAVSMLGCAGVILAGLRGALGATAVFVAFTLLRSLFGIFGSASNPAAQAYVAARTGAETRTAALATLTSAFGLGTILGPGVAPFFEIPSLGLSAPMFAFAAIAAAVGAVVWRLLPDDDPAHEAPPDALHHGAPATMPSIAGGATGGSARAAAIGRRPRLRFRDPRVWPFMVYGFVSGSVQAAAGQALGFLVIDHVGGAPAAGAQAVGIALMVGAGAMLLAQWGLIRMLGLTAATLMRWGAALAAAGLAAIALASGYPGILAGFALASLGYGFARPGFVAGASLVVGDDEQGAVAGAVTAVNGACFIVAPTIGIGLYEIGGAWPYAVGAAVQAALLGYALLNPVLRREPVGVD
jgi:MFS family permease